MSLSEWAGARILLSECSLSTYTNNDLFLTCGICKQIMVEASQIICGCKFCRQCIEDFIRGEGRGCPLDLNIDCRRVILGSMDDVHTEKESNNMIMELRVHCPIVGCGVEGELRDMIAHVNECRTKNGDDMINKEEKTMTLRSTVDLLEENVLKKSRELEDMKLEFMEKMSSMEMRIREGTSRIDSLVTKVNELTLKMNEEKNDEFIWKISDFSLKKERGSNITSEAFYTRKNGYKLRMKLYPNGIKNNGTHLSLYFQLIKGEYDDVLPWPFEYDVTLALLDQEGSLEHFSKTKEYSDDEVRFYEKPETSENESRGYSQFIKLSSLRSRPYLMMNDTLYIRCSVIKT